MQKEQNETKYLTENNSNSYKSVNKTKHLLYDTH